MWIAFIPGVQDYMHDHCMSISGYYEFTKLGLRAAVENPWPSSHMRFISGSQKNLNILSSKHCKTVNTCKMAFESYHLCSLQLSYSTNCEVCVELEDFVVPCDTNAQLHGSHGKPLLNMSLLWLSQPKRVPTPALE